MTMSDGRIRCYLVHEQREDVLWVTPGDVDSILLWAQPYPVSRGEFTTITVRPGAAGPAEGDLDARAAD
ncbi:hypothetical protein ABZ747_29465 [Kitasatospora cineracea]|uniref:hypothetical protein n=1 Tax=Kitasatospora cineracea TaxID=88074 RepID=UPI00340A5B44